MESIVQDLNCLNDPDRTSRRKALERLHGFFATGSQASFIETPELLQRAWDNAILPMILKILHDSVEKCRELAVSLLTIVSTQLREVEQTMVLAVPVIVQRIGQLPVLEESEDMRLSLITFLRDSLISRCSLKTLLLIIEHMSQVLSVSLADPFHEVKKATCDVILSIVERDKNIPKCILENLLKALLPNLGHTHFKVRVSILQGINAIMQCGLSAVVITESLAPNVRALAFDRTEQVRQLFFQYVAQWIGYEKYVSMEGGDLSFSQGHFKLIIVLPQLLPLLLLGISDESVEIGLASLSMVERVGKVYELFPRDGQSSRRFDSELAEREDQPKIELANNMDEKYEETFHAPFKARPGKGCRKMVQDFLGELVNIIANNLVDWSRVTRLGAARLLHTVLIIAEEKSNYYLDLLIPAICSAVGDDDVAVAKYVVRAAHVLGRHVPPHNCLPLVLDRILISGATLVQVSNGLVVLSGLLYGMQRQVMNKDLVVQVSQHLAKLDLDQAPVRQQTLAVFTNLMKVGQSFCESSCVDILVILLQVQCFESETKVKQMAMDLEENLAQVIGLTCAKKLYDAHFAKLAAVVTAGHESWLGNSLGHLLFKTFMKKAGFLIGTYMESLLPIFKDCLHSDRDPSVRIDILKMLDELFEVPDLATWWTNFASIVLGDLLVPCGVWKVGKVGAAVRHAAMVAIGTFLRRGLCSQVLLGNLLHSDQMLAVIISCLEEDYYVDTRSVTCHVLENVLRISGNMMTESERNEVRKALEKRLDDSNDNVRLRILPAISAFFYTMHESYSDSCVKSFVSSILLHMDDHSKQIREAAYKTLEICTIRRPSIVEELVKNVCGQHQMGDYCDNLLAKAAHEQNIRNITKS